MLLNCLTPAFFVLNVAALAASCCVLSPVLIFCFSFHCNLLGSLNSLYKYILVFKCHLDTVLTLEFNMISGALYQRVATYSVRKPV